MSHSIGDRHAHGRGVKEVPDVIEVNLCILVNAGNDGDVCLILATTDGVWDALSCSDIIALAVKWLDVLMWSHSDLCKSIYLTAKK